MTRSLLLLYALLLACEAAPPRRLVIRAGRLLDGSGAPARSAVRVIVEDGSIVAIEPDSDEPTSSAAERVIDLRQSTVMPGLVDAHTHLAFSGACSAGVGLGIGQMLRNLHGLVAAGVTTAADLGSPLEVGLAVRRYVGTARHRGPRVLIAGPLLTTNGGYMTEVMNGAAIEHGLAVPVDSVEQGIAAVQRLADAEVDLIKVGMQERSFSKEPLAMPSRETLCAVVREAHQQELRVVAHATSNAGYRLGLDCGADAIVHGALEPLDESVQSELAAEAIPVAPTLFVFEALLFGAEHPEYLESASAARMLSEEVRGDLERYVAAARTTGASLPDIPFARGVEREEVRRASAANRANTAALHVGGVPLALGTDGGVCFNWVGQPVVELRRIEQAGVPTAEVIRIATSGSAGLLGLGDALGRIRVGYRADIIAVDGEPERDLAALERVRTVIIDGVEQRLEEPTWAQLMALAWRLAWTRLTE